jgi:glycosylphosphatidylinositol transamidase
VISHILTTFYKPNLQTYQLIKSFSLLILGMALSTLATLNFSLAFMLGLLTAPLSFVDPTQHPALKWAMRAVLGVVAPATVLYSASSWAGVDVKYVLAEASFGWHVWGMYTPIAIWGIWWPAWTLGMINNLGVV